MSAVAYSTRKGLNFILPDVQRRSGDSSSIHSGCTGRCRMMRKLTRAVLLSAVCAVFVACSETSPTGSEAVHSPSAGISRSNQSGGNLEEQPAQFDPTAATTDTTSAVNRGGFIGSGH